MHYGIKAKQSKNPIVILALYVALLWSKINALFTE